MSNIENINTFVRTLGNQFIKGKKHFIDDVFVSPDNTADAAEVYLTIDENGRLVVELENEKTRNFNLKEIKFNSLLTV